MTAIYRGRFAPSPTGPLHFGSLVAAVASYLEAKPRGRVARAHRRSRHAAQRIPALPTTSCAPSSASGALGRCRHLSKRAHRAYQAELQRLREHVLDAVAPAVKSPIRRSCGGRPGLSRYLPRRTPARQGAARLRLDVRGADIRFETRPGPVQQDLAREIGDFVLFRAGQVSLSARGGGGRRRAGHHRRGAWRRPAGSTPRQIHLQRLRLFTQPRYLHVPVAVNANGEKLTSKHTPRRWITPATGGARACATLSRSAAAGRSRRCQHRRILELGAPNWRIDRAPRARSAPAPAG